MKTKTVPVNKLRLDGDTQPRAEIDDQLVSEFADAFKAGAKFPPIVVFFDGVDHWLADGFHRRHAARKADVARLRCEVHQGTREEARWYSYSANQTHGLRRSNEDKRRAVLLALKHPKGAELSDGQIAEHVGVHLNTVAKYRAELTADGTTTNCVSRTGRDGRTINTANIGRRATSGDTEGPQPEAEMSPCHHCGGEHPIGGFNPCHDAAEQVATVLADDVAPELSTILWADYVRPAVQKWIDEWEGASGILASVVVKNKATELRELK